jgi:hypothetical protein
MTTLETDALVKISGDIHDSISRSFDLWSEEIPAKRLALLIIAALVMILTKYADRVGVLCTFLLRHVEAQFKSTRK